MCEVCAIFGVPAHWTDAAPVGAVPAESTTVAARAIQQQFKSDVCSVYLLDADRRHLELAATIGLEPSSVGRVRMSGFVAWLLWLAVHLVALTGFRNRIAVRVLNAITTQQVFARQVDEAVAAVVNRGAAAFRSSSRS